MNIDASFVNGRPAGYGMVARDFEGEVMTAAITFPIASLSPLSAEAGCFHWALRLAIELGF